MRRLFAGTVVAAILGFVLTSCASGESATVPTESMGTSVEPSAEPTNEPTDEPANEPADKRVSLDDLTSALLTMDDLPAGDWVPAAAPVTIGESGGRIWKPDECGERFTTYFEQDLAPPTEDFVTVTFEEPSSDDFRIVTENISRWDRPIDIAAIQEEFTSLIAECEILTSDQIAITLRPLDIDGAAALRIDYSTGALAFTFDIAYAQVGTYLVGVTNSGVEATAAELRDLLTAATDNLQQTLRSAPAVTEDAVAA